MTTTPSWLGLIPSDSRALYTAYGVISASAYSATWGHAAYGQLPATQFQFNPSQDARFDIILPPHDNVVRNWGFETGSLGADDWTASGTPTPVVTDTFRHTGNFATWMGCTRLFEPALKLPGSTTATSIRATADISGMLHITWRAQIDSTNADVYYMQRSSSGVWSGPANVSQSAAWSDDPRLALDDSGNVHVVWSEQSPGNYDIFYARKSNGIWSSPQNVSNTPGASGFPELVADRSGNVHIIWSEDSSSVGYVRQLSNGTWSSPATISGSTGGIYPRLVVDGAGTIHVIWEGTVGWNTDLFHAQRLASGIWSSPVNISNTTGPSVNAALFVEDNGTVHIVWSENGIHIYYAQRNTSGTWSRSVNIGSGLEPQIAVGADGVVHVVVDGSTYTQRQADGTWSAPYRFADGSTSVIQTSAYDPRTTSTMMVLDNNRVLHYVWAASDDIFYSRRSENGGWLKPLNLSSSVATSYQPQIAVTADGAAFVVWQDSQDYMPELSGMFFTHPAMAAQNNDSTLAQMVTVPVTAANPVLSFLYEYQTGHTSPISDNWLSVKVSNGATVTSLLTETSSVVAWEHRWFNVSRWKGQPITVTFGLRQVAGRPCNWFRLDEVSIGSWLTPVPLSVYPRRVSVRTPTVMTITGQNFIAIPPSPSYTQGPSVTLGSINLPDAQWINTNTLTATIPALDAGIYDLVVTNPGGQAGGLPRALLVDVRVYLPITLKQH